MRSYTEAGLETALRSVGVSEGDVLLVHSALFALGRLRHRAPREIPAAVYHVLRRVVGSSGTIAVPTFNFDFCKGEPFDRAETPSRGMGAFSEYVRGRPESVRSRHPTQSVAVVGPHAEAITRPDPLAAFDPQGSFGIMLELGAKLVLLGATVQAASLVHYAEERVGVPYRYWKEFEGRYIDGETADRRTYRMYVRDLDLDPQLVLDPIESGLTGAALLATAAVGGGQVAACRFRDFIDVAMDLLREDPWRLVKNSDP